MKDYQKFDAEIPDEKSVIFYNLVLTEPDRIVSVLLDNYGGYRTEEFVGSQITYCLKSLV